VLLKLLLSLIENSGASSKLARRGTEEDTYDGIIVMACGRTMQGEEPRNLEI